ncbi:glutathione S-transferase family protein [Sphingomonas carotinifaciens]|uniref:Glutathione S-transferase n=1 Tax=Sphingomonas carotinifaciens TaxID=1166323 RepID=A0A1G7EVM4_9SPHN|nr:glutathione S-transferase family protein [Sphingomonas carotinifaciens]MBB4085760.1 glutathione S-transferase [Sphingomonas carotinifaciens]MWC45152.1 glutathione S-transferase family protein [Sphingomonas carotinifaciens]SDE67536.1 glutathione S-transferase [Sphingomonas carotinifaciens]
MKLIIGNKAYSSWSLRGWLAAKQSGLPFEEVVVPLYDADWDARREGAEFAPSSGKVPILWDGDAVVWDSLAIVDYLADKVGRDRFWPADEAARAMARSMAAEMHASFTALRRKHSMNIRQVYEARRPDDDVLVDLARIMELWAQARARFGGNGDFLFGSFGAADIMFAPVVTRIVTYQLPIARFAAGYMDAVLQHPFMQDWIAAAQEEEWLIERFEQPTP